MFTFRKVSTFAPANKTEAGMAYIPASAGKHGIKATDKRETVIAHIIPYILYNKVKIPFYITSVPFKRDDIYLIYLYSISYSSKIVYSI